VDIEETSIKDKSQILFPFTVGPYFIATVTWSFEWLTCQSPSIRDGTLGW
jgi:hypothetical protein